MLSVHQSDIVLEEIVPVSACFGLQCSVAPTRGEELEQVVCVMDLQR